MICFEIMTMGVAWSIVLRILYILVMACACVITHVSHLVWDMGAAIWGDERILHTYRLLNIATMALFYPVAILVKILQIIR